MEKSGIDWDIVEDSSAIEYVNEYASTGNAVQMAYVPKIGPIRKTFNAIQDTIGADGYHGTPQTSAYTLARNDSRRGVFGNYGTIDTDITPHEDTLRKGIEGNVQTRQHVLEHASEKRTAPRPGSTVGLMRWERGSNNLYTLEDAVILESNVKEQASQTNIPQDRIKQKAKNELETNLSYNIRQQQQPTVSAPPRSYTLS